MADQELKPISKGLFTIPSSPGEKINLIGSKCRNCGRAYFPGEVVCNACFQEDMEETLLSNIGKLYSFTIVRQKPMAYAGPVPYAMGLVSLPEGVTIMSLLTGCEFEKLELDMDVELVLEKIARAVVPCCYDRFGAHECFQDESA